MASKSQNLHGLNFLIAPKEGAVGFLITLLRCETEVRVVEFEMYWQTSKMECILL